MPDPDGGVPPRQDDLVPLSSRIRTRLVTEPAPREELLDLPLDLELLERLAAVFAAMVVRPPLC